MRRAQLLSLDAMLSLIIMMFVFAVVINTSTMLKGEITSMIGWYERANIADNMLDVLTKGPGDPVDWENNPDGVVVVGLAEKTGNFLSYNKVLTILQERNSESVFSSLINLTGGENSWLSFKVKGTLSKPPEVEVVTNPGTPSYVPACSPAGLSTDSPVTVKCENGEFEFSGYQPPNPPPWWVNNYSNQYSVCVLSDTFVGSNFDLNIGDYFGVNGSLSVGSDGHVTAGEWYVTGDTNIGDSGYATSHGNAYIGGDLEIQRNGHYTVDGNLYVGGQTYVHDSGYLYVSGNLYSRGKLTLEGGSSVSVENSIYVFSDAKIGTQGLTLNGDFYVKGSYDMFSGGTVNVTGLMYVGDSMRVIGDTTVGELYVGNGLTIDEGKTLEVNGDAYIVGNLNINNGKMIVHGDLYVEGSITITWSGQLQVDGNLYVTGSIIIPDNSNPDRFYSIGGNITHSIPSGVTKPNFDVQMPPIKLPPCIAASGGPTIEINSSLSSLSQIFYPVDFSSIGNITIVNGKLATETIAENSMKNASWIESAKRIIPASVRVYNRSYTVTPAQKLPLRLYDGTITNNIQGNLRVILSPMGNGNLLLISAFSSVKSGITAVYITRDGERIKVVSKQFMVNESGEIYAEYPNVCNVAFRGGGVIEIPIDCLIADVNPPIQFALWIYSVDGFSKVKVEDESNLNAVLDRRYLIMEIDLKIWERR